MLSRPLGPVEAPAGASVTCCPGLAHLVLVLTLLIWSFSFLAAARLRQRPRPRDALGARFLPVLLGAGLLLLWRRPLRLPRAAWWPVAAMGLLGVPVYNLAFLHGLKTVPTGTAALIIALNPVFTAVLARLVLERRGSAARRAVGLLLRPLRRLRRDPLRDGQAGGLALPLERARAVAGRPSAGPSTP